MKNISFIFNDVPKYLERLAFASVEQNKILLKTLCYGTMEPKKLFYIRCYQVLFGIK